MPASTPAPYFRNCIAAALLCLAGWAFSTPPAWAQQKQPFGREKVETRQFRNKDVERAANRGKGGHNHAHGTKGHKGHKH